MTDPVEVDPADLAAVFGLAIEIDDRSPEEQAALDRVARLLDPDTMPGQESLL